MAAVHGQENPHAPKECRAHAPWLLDFIRHYFANTLTHAQKGGGGGGQRGGMEWRKQTGARWCGVSIERGELVYSLHSVLDSLATDVFWLVVCNALDCCGNHRVSYDLSFGWHASARTLFFLMCVSALVAQGGVEDENRAKKRDFSLRPCLINCLRQALQTNASDRLQRD